MIFSRIFLFDIFIEEITNSCVVVRNNVEGVEKNGVDDGRVFQKHSLGIALKIIKNSNHFHLTFVKGHLNIF